MINVSEHKIMQAAKTIAERRPALLWLEEHGRKLTGRNGDVIVYVDLKLGGACNGAKEAAEVLSSYARLRIGQAVQDAIECCNNDIFMALQAIREEVNK